jgi:phenylacetate-CoA ligase
VPYFGCKITPTNLEDVVFSLPELAASVNSFALLVSEDEHATKRLAFAFELQRGFREPTDSESLRAQVLDRLRELNQDFREASRFIPSDSVPTVEFHLPETGPFAGHDIRLKRHYVQRR